MFLAAYCVYFWNELRHGATHDEAEPAPLRFQPSAESPETARVFWVRQGKERLALANISGAMMIQATVPSAFGLFFTPWSFDTPLALAALATTMSIVYLMLTLRAGRLSAARLTLAASGYVVFAVAFMLARGFLIL